MEEFSKQLDQTNRARSIHEFESNQKIHRRWKYVKEHHVVSLVENLSINEKAHENSQQDWCQHQSMI